jgi:hypothetical protein
VEIAIDEKARADLDAAPVTLGAREIALQDALDQILLPRGFTWSLTASGLTVKR